MVGDLEAGNHGLIQRGKQVPHHTELDHVPEQLRPSDQLPFSGEYKAYVWAEMGSATALTATLGVNIAGSARINGASKVMASGVGNTQDMSYLHPFTEWAAGTIINTGYQTSSANNLLIAGRRIEILPRRVSF